MGSSTTQNLLNLGSILERLRLIYCCVKNQEAKIQDAFSIRRSVRLHGFGAPGGAYVAAGKLQHLNPRPIAAKQGPLVAVAGGLLRAALQLAGGGMNQRLAL